MKPGGEVAAPVGRIGTRAFGQRGFRAAAAFPDYQMARQQPGGLHGDADPLGDDWMRFAGGVADGKDAVTV